MDLVSSFFKIRQHFIIVLHIIENVKSWFRSVVMYQIVKLMTGVGSNKDLRFSLS